MFTWIYGHIVYNYICLYMFLYIYIFLYEKFFTRCMLLLIHFKTLSLSLSRVRTRAHESQFNNFLIICLSILHEACIQWLDNEPSIRYLYILSINLNLQLS